MQNVLDVHDTPVNEPPSGGLRTGCADHLLPFQSSTHDPPTAAQNLFDGHDTSLPVGPAGCGASDQ
jgi:hypothetical protein